MVMTIEGAGRQGFTPRHEPETRRRRPSPKPRPPAVSEGFVRDGGRQGEQARAQIAAFHRAIREAEDALAIVAEADHGLAGIQHILMKIDGGLERLAMGELPPDGEVGESTSPGTPEAWLAQCLADLDRIAVETRFGEKHLLDGSLGCAGMALGDGLTFVSAGDGVRSSPAGGYEVMLTREPTRATLLGEVALSEEAIAGGMVLTLAVEGREASFTTRADQSPREVAEGLQDALMQAQLPLHVDATPEGLLLVQHRQFGSAHHFWAHSSLPGVLSNIDGSRRRVANGTDIAGTIHEEPAIGVGQILTGAPGNTATAGLEVYYTGLPYTGFTGRLPRSRPAILESRVFAGRIILARQALAFRLDSGAGGTVFLGLNSARPKDLGRNSAGGGRFKSLAEIQVGGDEADHGESDHGEAVRESRALLARVIVDIAQRRENLAELSRERLKPILAQLRVKAENRLAAADSENFMPGGGKATREAGGPARGPRTITIGREASHGELDQVRMLSQWIRQEGGQALTAHAQPSQRTLMGLLHEDA